MQASPDHTPEVNDIRPGNLRLHRAFAQICYWVGFLVPFIASHYVGMPLARHPAIAALNVVLWAAGLTFGYLVYINTKRVPKTVPLWIRICGYLSAIPATFVMLGLVFGFLYYPTIEKSIIVHSVTFLLMLTLFVMGVQITGADWKAIGRHPKLVSVAVLLRWICMPLFAYFLARLILMRFLPEPAATTLTIGMVILGTTATGVASNTLTLVSRGDLALSVSVTSINTIIAPFLQPFLIQFFVGRTTHVNTHAIFLYLIKVILIPVIFGTFLGALWPGFFRRIRPLLTAIAVVSLGFILMANMSLGTAVLLKQLWILPALIAALVIKGFAGLGLGYYIPKFFGFDHKQRVAACFEVGVENATLSMVLAMNYFSPLAAIPALLYGKLQNLIAISVFVSRFQKVSDGEELPAPKTAAVHASN